MIEFNSKKELLQNPEVRAEYEGLQAKYNNGKHCCITASEFCKNIDAYLEKVDNEHKILIITDEEGRSVVLMSAEDYKKRWKISR